MLLQSISYIFCLNLSIDWFETLRVKIYCSETFASFLFFVAKVIGKWSEISFLNNSFNFYQW